ncbi:hypothetical protein HG537_0D04160 [Torulaspora globosa]|uniref:Vacuolar protein sorting-associated protein 54 n=1 Tax=Torulaspora globosa TaxID=48254 RepID=A0A7H9HVE2_9SACH|nr:hypothetical protein HG537_0D04160 [Torulaspora sp. CBS 2947]
MSEVEDESDLKNNVGDIVESAPKIIVDTRSPSIDDSTSLNDDLVSVSGSNARPLYSSRMSLDSYSIRRSFDSSVMGRHSRSFGFDKENHSGSMEYSPLGNNSIYEIVMNTRRKDWLAYPTVNDIPPVPLSKPVIEDSWKKAVKQYVTEVKSESSIFESTSNLRSMTRMEQLRQLEKYDKSNPEVCTDESVSEGAENPRELDEVPSFYFEKDFQLDNPRTFHRIVKGIDLQLSRLTVSDQSTRDEAHFELKDRLNYYLDTVENLLVAEISKSSHKFFHALADVDQIQQKAGSTVAELDKLTEAVEIADGEKIRKRIDSLQKVFKRKNVQKLEQGLLQVKQVLTRSQECKELYDKGEFEQCLDLIGSVDCLIKGDDSHDQTVQRWVADWPYKLVDLKSVPALTETREFLTNLMIEIGGKFSLQLCDILLKDVETYCESVSVNETLERFQNASSSRKFLEMDPDIVSTVKGLIHQLRRCEELASSLELYREKCITEVKSIIKKHLPQKHSTSPLEEQDAVDQPRSQQSVSSGSKLSRLIREQTPAEFQEMLVTIFTQSSEALRRFSRHQKLLLDLSLSEIASTPTSQENDNQQSMIIQLDIRSGINETIKILQLRMGKIIAVRRELTATLRFDHFLKLYTICVLFIQECEAVSGEFLTKYFSDVLAAQIKNYISSQGSRNMRTIQIKINAEKWIPFIVDRTIQKDVNDIVSSVDLDPLDWVQYSDLLKPAHIHEDTSQTQPGHRKSVVVGDKTFVASEALLTCIAMIKEIFILSTNLPGAYLPHFEKLAYDLLYQFNTYAIDSVTLPDKTLSKSGKNLSIMSESLDCLAEFVLITQRFYQRLLNFTRETTQHELLNYNQLLQKYQASAETIYRSNAPPPPV